MGFSTSAATVIIVVGVIVGFTAMYSSFDDASERVIDAEENRNDRQLDRANSDITIVNVNFDSGSGTLNVSVNNTGSQELSANATTLIVDGEFVSPDERWVNGEDRDVWAPGEQLNLTVLNTNDPSRVKVVAEYGVAAMETGV